ncbi:MAG: serine/threonine protein phosphatase [Rhodobacterales bacterium]|nr:MAG: serine/threonine protein phosphatase [Rhodobacterales bacterium]
MIYAVGDIHGHLNQLDRALRLIEADGGADARVVFLGDYVDRGPDSAGVLQRLIDGQAEGRDWICLKGNHDRLLQTFVENGNHHDDNIRSGKSWLHEALGGLTTLASYGVEGDDPETLWKAARKAVPQAHLDFLQNLPLWHGEDDLIFVHAGIRPGLPMGFQQEDDLVWIREPFLSDTRDHGALIVHGHTVQERPVHCGNRVNLDGGAGYGRLLVPAVFTGRRCEILTERGRWPLEP